MCYLCLVLQRQGSEEGKKNKEERNYNAGKLPIIVQNENHKQNWKKKKSNWISEIWITVLKSANSVELAELQHSYKAKIIYGLYLKKLRQ